MENSAFVIEGSRLVKCTDPDLEEIIVPEGITEIGERAFQNGWMKVGTAVRYLQQRMLSAPEITVFLG